MLRSICKGEANHAGIDLVSRALAAVAAAFGGDTAPIEAARAALMERGLSFEILFKSKTGKGYEPRAYLAIGATDELVL